MAEQRSSQALWISEHDVEALLSVEDAIEVLASAYRSAAADGADNMRRAHARRGEAILHAVGGILPGAGLAGTKTWLYSPGGAAPLQVIFRLDDGSVAAVIEAFSLGQRRTAATSALGTRLLARPDADVLALLGTGKQAFAQAQAVAAVRPLQRIHVFGRDPERRETLCRLLREALGIEVQGFADVAAALKGAAIVSTITRAAEPIVAAEMIEPGMHINAVGAIVPGRSELEARAVGRCDVIVADSPVQAREDSAELNAAAQAGLLRLDDIVGLAELVTDPAQGRRRPEDITLLKPLGVGLSDLAIGAELLARAAQAGLGTALAVSRKHDVQSPDPEPKGNAYV